MSTKTISLLIERSLRAALSRMRASSQTGSLTLVEYLQLSVVFILTSPHSNDIIQIESNRLVFKDFLFSEIKLKGELMRSSTNKSLDSAIFRRTAVKTKAINISPKNMRGGTRL